MDLSKTNSPSTLTISDNLNLDNLSVPNIPDDIVFPNELNNYLRQQVQVTIIISFIYIMQKTHITMTSKTGQRTFIDVIMTYSGCC